MISSFETEFFPLKFFIDWSNDFLFYPEHLLLADLSVSLVTGFFSYQPALDENIFAFDVLPF